MRGEGEQGGGEVIRISVRVDGAGASRGSRWPEVVAVEGSEWCRFEIEVVGSSCFRLPFGEELAPAAGEGEEEMGTTKRLR